ncbi:DnaA ATPase domain-containing protein [Geomobilimonas luticola]|uniref:ATP-binding protein n=1 Tax=Geomobilimonas luticola TaxID=1114878 RepID=A0ABS5SIN4_9BACT|nr:DnaA/Hda family protein [Geomobilimonas luticola]MBT0654767.1 ATP-binding protein [Geomobilimonas luticola]
MQQVFDFPVTPRYRFDNFVVCGGNETAYRFARLLADPRGTENLLYIYGPPGSGKTHLLSALGECLTHQSSPFPYLSCRDIDTLYRGDYTAEATSRLAEHFLNAPALIIDDLHLLPDQPKLRVELWQLFNDFYTSGKKMALTGLYPPKELPHLDDHLVSRLLWGLVAKVDVSDDDSRRMIMKKLAEDRQVLLPADVIDYLLVNTRRDIPALVEALDRINRHALATQRKITVRQTREALALGG